jgi:hypothetical protein
MKSPPISTGGRNVLARDPMLEHALALPIAVLKVALFLALESAWPKKVLFLFSHD